MLKPDLKKKKSVVTDMLKRLLDPDTDILKKKMLLAQLVSDDSLESTKIIETITTSNDTARDALLKKQQDFEMMMQALKDGPLRLATFISSEVPNSGGLDNRAHVSLENGDTAFPVIHDLSILESLACGDPVTLDAQARTLVYPASNSCRTGEVGELKQRLGEDRVMVALNDLHSEAYRISAQLKLDLDEGRVAPGSRLLVCSRQRIAFEFLPQEKGVSKYDFLEQGTLKMVDAERDIGCPHPFIQELTDHARDVMLNPDLPQKYGVRPMQTRLLKGLTGTGKTFSILAVIHSIYRVMSEVTGAPIDKLPNRVLRMRMSQTLNKYLGESDKRQDRFYDEVTQMADEPFVWKGRQWKLPVIARCEEIDALARARNGSEDVMGRIQTTALERLDHLSGELGDKLCIFLFSTNVPELCDQAFLRRCGGQIIDFGRIGRRQFQAILSKKIRGLPLHPALGDDQQEAERRLNRDVTNWMFSPNGHDPGQVEVTFAGSATTTVKHRRDLLTGSVVDLSLQQACAEAMQLEKQGSPKPGLTTEILLSAFDQQIRGMCAQVTEFNAHNYLSLPEGARVASVRRIEQPAVEPFNMARPLEQEEID